MNGTITSEMIDAGYKAAAESDPENEDPMVLSYLAMHALSGDPPVDAAFDLLEGLKRAWAVVDRTKGDNIAGGFARMTGGIDVPWLIEQLGPPQADQKIDRVERAGHALLCRAANGRPGTIKAEIDEWEAAIAAIRGAV